MKILKHVLGFLIFLKFCSPYVIQLNSTNWKQILDGEWLVKFHAPWCPACRQFSPIWQQLSDDSSINAFVADVDVTESPVLSFIFFVKRLPTVYHASSGMLSDPAAFQLLIYLIYPIVGGVTSIARSGRAASMSALSTVVASPPTVKNGLFRVYDGARTLDDLRVYVKSAKYETETPLPWYYSPASFHMHIFIRFMDLGIFITNTHQAFLDAGYSNWMSFLIIGLSTIFSGLFIGIILVLIFDCFFPPRPQILRFIRKPKKVEESLQYETDKSRSNVHDDDVSEENVNDEITEIRQRKVDNNEVHDS
ncbi:unnamed protein product [Schistosoma margrebowiei]|uniref:Uncharacterized protein n=1 Tax=Schistosoma margrebowiei TaxID=48269 RepID=A0A183MLB1_9TREM|nr:unnamed protein product [Schistosoma margrebowiei]